MSEQIWCESFGIEIKELSVTRSPVFHFSSDKPECYDGVGDCWKCPSFNKAVYIKWERWSETKRTCEHCEGLMLRRVKSYPPFCGSTYEEFVCSDCGKGWAWSA